MERILHILKESRKEKELVILKQVKELNSKTPNVLKKPYLEKICSLFYPALYQFISQTNLADFTKNFTPNNLTSQILELSKDCHNGNGIVPLLEFLDYCEKNYTGLTSDSQLNSQEKVNSKLAISLFFNLLKNQLSRNFFHSIPKAQNSLKYDVFFKELPMPVFLINSKGKIEQLNQEALGFLKLFEIKTTDPQSLDPNSLFQIVFPWFSIQHRNFLKKASDIDFFSRQLIPQGLLGVYEFTFARLKPQYSQETKTLVFIKKATDNKKSQTELWRKQSDFPAILNDLPAMIYQCKADPLRTMEYISQGAIDITGYRACDILQNVKISYGDLIHPAYRNQTWLKIHKALDQKKPFHLTYRIIDSTGREKWVLDQGQGIFNQQGKLVGLKGFITDITKRKQAENNKREQDSKLFKIQKLESLGALAGGIAHDFNNYLVGVLGNAGLAMLEVSESSQANRLLKKIEISGQKLAELTNQLLAYSGKGSFALQKLNLSNLVGKVQNEFTEIHGEKTTIEYDLAKNLPHILADVEKIRQVIMNLVTNACEAMPQGGKVKIKTGSFFADKSYLEKTYINENITKGDYVFLEVKDYGKGMDEITQLKLFDPFFSTKFQGRGLGLAAVLGIVRSHKGTLKVQSTQDQGTSIIVLFPVPHQKTGKMQPLQKWSTGFDTSKTVLVVDDEKLVCEVAKGALERCGLNVLTANDGYEGLETFKKTKGIDLVLLDVTMPGMAGDEVFSKMHGIRKDIKVILSSGFTKKETSMRFQEKKPAGFIQKPYLPSQLADKVKKALDS